MPNICKKDKTPMTLRLDGKTVIITGCSAGIGKETARNLAHRGARIIMACRSLTKTEPIAEEIRKETGATVIVHELDLADFQSIRKFCNLILETESQIHLLINNAGVMMCPQSTTKDGFEMQFGTNHLGHFLLTVLLLERIKESAPARIINVASTMYIGGKIHWDDINLEKNYTPTKAYCQSKLANILFTRELAKRLEGSGVNVYTLHPGAVKTELQRHVMDGSNKVFDYVMDKASSLFLKNPVQGAQTTIYCAVSEDLNDKTGLYYSDSSESCTLAKARDDEAAKRLWDLSMKLTQLDTKTETQVEEF